MWLVDLDDKARPAVLISRNASYGRLHHVTVASITSTLRDRPFAVSVGPHNGLQVESIVNCDQINTVPVSWLVEHWGSLSRDQLKQVDDALHYSLGLDD